LIPDLVVIPALIEVLLEPSYSFGRYRDETARQYDQASFYLEAALISVLGQPSGSDSYHPER
jgi:hypothetical protein